MLRGLRFAVLVAVCLLGGRAPAQRSPLTTGDEAESVESVLHAMVGRAGVIFTGTVSAVRRRPAADGGAGVVEVEFAVDRGLRGSVTGGRYVLREWAGLWEGTDERYRVGQRLLMLLHAPGASGLSSPVAGMNGAIPIRPGANATAEATVDLRWVAAQVSRGPVRYRPETPRVPRARPMAEAPHLAGTITPVEAPPTAVVPGASTEAACASVSSVVSAILAWGAESR